MSAKKKEFESQLPARISGLVFWGLTLIGVAIVVVVIAGLESDLTVKNQRNAKYLTHSIEDAIGLEPEYPVTKIENGRIRLVVNSLRDVLGFTSIVLREDDNRISIGVSEIDDQLYQEEIQYHTPTTSDIHAIKFDIFLKMLTLYGYLDTYTITMHHLSLSVLLPEVPAMSECSGSRKPLQIKPSGMPRLFAHRCTFYQGPVSPISFLYQ